MFRKSTSLSSYSSSLPSTCLINAHMKERLDAVRKQNGPRTASLMDINVERASLDARGYGLAFIKYAIIGRLPLMGESVQPVRRRRETLVEFRFRSALCAKMAQAEAVYQLSRHCTAGVHGTSVIARRPSLLTPLISIATTSKMPSLPVSDN